MKEFFTHLTEKIKNSNKVIIMSHRYMDLDGFGAALGLHKIIEKYEKESYIIMNEEERDESITKSIEKIRNKSKYNFISKEKILDKINENDLLIVLDVHKKEMVEEPLLIEKLNNIVIVDHHLKGESFVSRKEDKYILTTVSSTVEIIINYLKQENLEIEPVVATIMLSGMYIDTNSFNIKTSANTFIAAAYLMENGADNVMKQELFQENKKDFIRRQKLLKNSFMINDHLIICTLDKNIYAGSDLAKIAEELLQFEEVEASFAIGLVSENIVGVSARSLGKINVEKIMKEIGGGGHKTDAAARIENVSINKVREKLTEILK